MKTVLILGASGLVGGQLLKAALADPSVSRVVAPSRRPGVHIIESAAIVSTRQA